MKPVHDQQFACRRFESLLLGGGKSDSLSAEDRDFLNRHGAACETCRVSGRVADLMAFDDSGGPARPLDDLSRRRLISDLLDIDEASRGERSRSGSRVPFTGGRARRWMVAAAAAAVLIVVGLVVFDDLWRPRDAGTGAMFVPEAVMVSGTVRVDAEPLALGQGLLPQGEIQTADGGAVVMLPQGVTLQAGAHTRVKVAQSGRERVEISLFEGSLLVSEELEIEDCSLVVRTREGVIRVTGTVFQVLDGGDRVRVNVLDGSVDVLAPGDRSVRATRNHSVDIGSQAVSPVASSDLASVHRQVRALALFSRSQSASLTVNSFPPGATVLLDAAQVGKTPLSASIVPGVHELTVTFRDLPEAREQVNLYEGTTVNRTYDLRPMDDRPDQVEVVQAERPRPRKKAVRKRPRQDQPPPIKDVVVVTVGELLVRAQDLRSGREWQEAAASYRRLIESYPNSSEAQVALIPLGEILLDHLGDPQGAVDVFGSYLKSSRGGPLYQEALYNLARALRVVGNKRKEMETLRTYLRMYPEAIQAQNARTRLGQLECEWQGTCNDEKKPE